MIIKGGLMQLFTEVDVESTLHSPPANFMHPIEHVQ